jgi:hypothetical protein
MGFKKNTRNLNFADLAMATCLEQNRSIKRRKLGRLRSQIINTCSAGDLIPGSTAHTDVWIGYFTSEFLLHQTSSIPHFSTLANLSASNTFPRTTSSDIVFSTNERAVRLAETQASRSIVNRLMA